MLLRWCFQIFGWLGFCRHSTMLRRRIDGVLHLVCYDCGYAVPLLKRDE
jgi:hypothetical protein